MLTVSSICNLNIDFAANSFLNILSFWIYDFLFGHIIHYYFVSFLLSSEKGEFLVSSFFLSCFFGKK